MLIITKSKTKSRTSDWYQKNRERLSQERKQRYAEDSEYREQRKEASRKYRRGEQTPPIPSEAVLFSEAAKSIGVDDSTLRAWRHRNHLYPVPQRHSGRPWFKEKQVSLLKEINEFFAKYGNRPGKIKEDRKKELRAFIFANWD